MAKQSGRKSGRVVFEPQDLDKMVARLRQLERGKKVDLAQNVSEYFPIECVGRPLFGKEGPLRNPQYVRVRIYKRPNSNTISTDLSDCPYNVGSHGQRCKASHPDVDKEGRGFYCPYSVDLPGGLDGLLKGLTKSLD